MDALTRTDGRKVQAARHPAGRTKSLSFWPPVRVCGRTFCGLAGKRPTKSSLHCIKSCFLQSEISSFDSHAVQRECAGYVAAVENFLSLLRDADRSLVLSLSPSKATFGGRKSDIESSGGGSRKERPGERERSTFLLSRTRT